MCHLHTVPFIGFQHPNLSPAKTFQEDRLFRELQAIKAQQNRIEDLLYSILEHKSRGGLFHSHRHQFPLYHCSDSTICHCSHLALRHCSHPSLRHCSHSALHHCSHSPQRHCSHPPLCHHSHLHLSSHARLSLKLQMMIHSLHLNQTLHLLILLQLPLMYLH